LLMLVNFLYSLLFCDLGPDRAFQGSKTQKKDTTAKLFFFNDINEPNCTLGRILETIEGYVLRKAF
jgi:hypothetical protein